MPSELLVLYGNFSPSFWGHCRVFHKKKRSSHPVNKNNFPSKGQATSLALGNWVESLVDQHPIGTNGNSATQLPHRFETVGLLLRAILVDNFFRKEGANLLHIVVISGKASICDPRRFSSKNKQKAHTHTQNPRISPAFDFGNLKKGPSIYNFQVIQSKWPFHPLVTLEVTVIHHSKRVTFSLTIPKRVTAWITRLE